MYFSVEFNRDPICYFDFDDDKYTVLNLHEDEPVAIKGTINANDKKIGFLQIYEFDNDCNFYNKCDNYSDDCVAIADVICGIKGNILKKYLPQNSKLDVVFVLDRISIDEEYRGKGIGSVIVKNLLKMLNHQYGYGCAIFLSVSDYETAEKYGSESEEYLDGCKRLKSFYQNAGYTHVTENVYVCK